MTWTGHRLSLACVAGIWLLQAQRSNGCAPMKARATAFVPHARRQFIGSMPARSLSQASNLWSTRSMRFLARRPSTRVRGISRVPARAEHHSRSSSFWLVRKSPARSIAKYFRAGPTRKPVSTGTWMQDFMTKLTGCNGAFTAQHCAVDGGRSRSAVAFAENSTTRSQHSLPESVDSQKGLDPTPAGASSKVSIRLFLSKASPPGEAAASSRVLP